MIYGRFTQKATQALNYAKECSLALGHNYIGTEHLLWGLVKEGTGIAAGVLMTSGVTEQKVMDTILSIVGKGEGNQPVVGYTPRTKRVMELSYAETRRMGQNYIGTEHLLLGILREGESIAVRILLEMGIDISKLYENIITMLQFSHQFVHLKLL
jgi:ATP-dependent Clp protease ATP-binding subunit ClpC